MSKRHFSNVIFTMTALGLIVILTACDAGLSQTSSYNYLLLEFTSDRSQARVNEPVHMRFSITNTGRELAIAESKDTPVMDIRVSEVAGGTLLVWSEQNPSLVSHRLEWKPGESKVIEWSWTPKEGDIYLGGYHYISLNGILSEQSGVQAAGVRICASSVCQ